MKLLEKFAYADDKYNIADMIIWLSVMAVFTNKYCNKESLWAELLLNRF